MLARLARRLAIADRHAESVTFAQEAVTLARQLGARDHESHALVTLGIDIAALGDVETGLAHVRSGREASSHLGDDDGVARASYWETYILVEAGRHIEAAHIGLAAEIHAHKYGLNDVVAVDLSLVADAMVALGRWDDAADVLGRAEQYAPAGVVHLDIQERLALLEARTGRFDAASSRVAVLPDLAFHVIDPPRLVPLSAAIAELDLWLGDPGGAHRAIRDAIARMESATDVWVGHLGAVFALGIRAQADRAIKARSRRLNSGLDQARATAIDLAARMQAVSKDVVAHRPFYSPQAAAWLATCQAETSRLDRRPAPDEWLDAASAWDQLEMPYPAAYARMRAAGAMLAQRRDRPRARTLLASGYDVASGLGAHPLCEAIVSLAVRFRIQLPGVAHPDLEPDQPKTSMPAKTRDRLRPARRPMPGVFTPRERQVLRLVVEGRSDGDIADALAISKKTASVHVANIKGKLGARSRIEIAIDSIGLGLVERPASARN